MSVTAIMGSYRRGGTLDTAVDEALAAAAERGATVHKITLLDEPLEFCTNCRSCCQRPGSERGECVLDDRLNEILDQLDASEAIVLASPMNFWTVTALMKRFMERLLGYGYWPWGQWAPVNRLDQPSKRALVIVTSAAPRLVARWATNMVKLMRSVARLLGAREIETLVFGLVRQHADSTLSDGARRRARAAGARLVG